MTSHGTNRTAATILVLLTGALSIGCGVSTPKEPVGRTESPPEGITWTSFRDGAFSVALPDWPEVPPDDEATLKVVSANGLAVNIGRHAGPPRLVGGYLARILPDHGDFEDIELDDSDYRSVRVDTRLNADPALSLQIIFYYCDGFSYQISGSAPSGAEAEFQPLFDHVLAQAECSSVPSHATAEHGLVGMVLSPSNEDYGFEHYRAEIAMAREAGIQAAHTYIQWGMIEQDAGVFDWTVPDLIIDTLSLEGLRLSCVINYVHTSVLGEVPRDLKGKTFDDPELVERAADFAAAVAARYGDQLDYLALGNEVNFYFETHPNELDGYLGAFNVMRQAVLSEKPGTRVGTVLAFHQAVTANRLDLIQAFKIGDFLAYTYYPHAENFNYGVATEGFGAVLDQMIEASGETPFIVVENGFSSSQGLGSSESQQAAYLQATISALAARRDAFGMHIWYEFHDGNPDRCAEAALSFFPEDFDPATVEETSWNAFLDYLCSLGLRHHDGTPKQGWETLRREMDAYLQND